jgi:hypothetical protein
MSKFTRHQRLVCYLFIIVGAMIVLNCFWWGQPLFPNLAGVAYVVAIILTALWLESRLLKKQK